MNTLERWQHLFGDDIPMPDEARLWTQEMIERIWCGSWIDDAGRQWSVQLANNSDHIERLLADLGKDAVRTTDESPYVRQRAHESFSDVDVLEFGGTVTCDGAHAGTFERHLYVDHDGTPRLGVTHAELHLEEDFQGKGFMRRWLQETLPRYACAGIDDIYLNTERGGSWVWAAYDFEFQDGHYESRRDALMDVAAQLAAAFDIVKAVLSPQEQERTQQLIRELGQRIIANDSTVTLKEICEWAIEGRAVGKMLMERVEWYGQIETRKLAERVGVDLTPILGPQLGDMNLARTGQQTPATTSIRQISR